MRAGGVVRGAQPPLFTFEKKLTIIFAGLGWQEQLCRTCIEAALRRREYGKICDCVGPGNHQLTLHPV